MYKQYSGLALDHLEVPSIQADNHILFTGSVNGLGKLLWIAKLRVNSKVCLRCEIVEIQFSLKKIQ